MYLILINTKLFVNYFFLSMYGLFSSMNSYWSEFFLNQTIVCILVLFPRISPSGNSSKRTTISNISVLIFYSSSLVQPHNPKIVAIANIIVQKKSCQTKILINVNAKKQRSIRTITVLFIKSKILSIVFIKPNLYDLRF